MTAYDPTTWVNFPGTATPLSATNLNKLTDELEAQASAYSIDHSLPTWADGTAPALTDASPLNEMERITEAVATAAGLSYTSTVWESGWTPARNAMRLNKLEQQVAANSAIGGFGSALPARFTRPTGSVITVSTAAEFTAALLAVNPGQIIQGRGTIIGEFRCTRPGPYLIESEPGYTFEIMGPATSPSQPLRIEPGVSNVMLHNFSIRGARGPSSQGIYLKDCSYIEMVGLDIHSDFHDLIEPANTSGVMGIFSSASSHHCYGWYLKIWENGQNRTAYAPDHGWYMEGDDHWLIGSLVTDHHWGYGVHLYPIGHRRHVVNCTIVNSKRAGFITAGTTAIDDLVVNCISVDSPDLEYAYKFNSGSGHQLRNSVGWNPSTNQLVGTTVTSYTAMNPLLDSAYRPQAAALPLGESAYAPPLYRDGTVRTAATLGSEQHA